jgi:hypothetical protein
MALSTYYNESDMEAQAQARLAQESHYEAMKEQARLVNIPLRLTSIVTLAPSKSLGVEWAKQAFSNARRQLASKRKQGVLIQIKNNRYINIRHASFLLYHPSKHLKDINIPSIDIQDPKFSMKLPSAWGTLKIKTSTIQVTFKLRNSLEAFEYWRMISNAQDASSSEQQVESSNNIYQSPTTSNSSDDLSSYQESPKQFQAIHPYQQMQASIDEQMAILNAMQLRLKQNSKY